MKNKILFFLGILLFFCIVFSCDSKNQENFITDGTEIVEISLSDGGFKYSVRNDSVSIHGVDENTYIKLIIPEEIEGFPVTRIARNAFAEQKNIIEVVLPSTIKEIGENAFYNCAKLEKINFPSGLERIETQAFTYTSLLSIYLPATINYYGHSIFYDCTKLSNVELEEGSTIFPSLRTTAIQEVKLPSSIKTIMSYAFPSDIKEIILPEGLERIEEWAFYECENITSIKLPSTIKFLGYHCFYGVPITSLELPNGIEELDDGCFYGTKIEELYIPQSVKKIGGINCYWDDLGRKTYTLKKVTFACDLSKEVTEGRTILESSTYYVHDFPDEYYEGLNEYEIHNSKQRIEIVFEDTVKTIAGGINGDNFWWKTFEGAFKSIDFGNGIEIIESDAFGINIENLILPPSLKYMGENSFGEIKNLTIQSDFDNSFYNEYGNMGYVSPFQGGYEIDPDTGFYVLEPNEWGALEKVEAPIETITFTENVTTIPPELFEGDENRLRWIETINGPHLKHIGDSAFYYCQIDTSFSVTAEEVGEYAFYGAKLPSDTDLSKTIRFGVDSFHKTTFAGEVVITEDAEFLSYSYDRCFTFYESKIPSLVVNCNVAFESFARSTIGKLSFGPNVTYIEEQGFCYSSITGTVDFSNITYIGANAFYDCSAVEKFIFGNNPTTVKEQSFYNCANAEFEFNGYVNLDMDSAYAFAGCKKLKNLPPFRPQTEITDFVFEDCISLVELNLTNVSSLGGSFGGCLNIESIVGLDNQIFDFDEENGLLYMNNPADGLCYLVGAFYKLISEDVIISDSVDIIEDLVFYNCDKLKTININKSDKSVNINSRAFQNCVNLESYSLGYGNIERQAFKGCTSLTEVIIRTLTIGYQAFADCSNLSKITITGEDTYGDGICIESYAFSGCSLKEIHDFVTDFSWGKFSSVAWDNCGSVEHYYAYYCNSYDLCDKSKKQTACINIDQSNVFRNVREYIELTPEEWDTLNPTRKGGAF